MFLSVKEIGFFCLVFLLISVTIFAFKQKSKFKGILLEIFAPLVVSLFVTLILVLTYKFAKIANVQSDGFHFEVSPGKRCRGYPYMQSSNPELLEECGKILSKGKKMPSCDGMYVGRPYSFEYTPESNDQWKNERCKSRHVMGPTGLKSNPKLVESFDERDPYLYGNPLWDAEGKNNPHPGFSLERKTLKPQYFPPPAGQPDNYLYENPYWDPQGKNNPHPEFRLDKTTGVVLYITYGSNIQPGYTGRFPNGYVYGADNPSGPGPISGRFPNGYVYGADNPSGPGPISGRFPNGYDNPSGPGPNGYIR